MEIEELQAVWSEMSLQLEKQNKLTNKIIMQMTQERYSNKFSKVSTYETMGAVVCFIMAVYLLIHFSKLETWYQITSGIFTIAILLVLPIMVLRALNHMKRINIHDSNFTDTIVNYTKAKNQLLLTQRIGIYVSFVLLFASLPVFGKIIGDKDILIDHGVLFWYFPIMGIFLFLFTRWGYKCYKGITNAAENILKELEN
ncbi:MAG: hypothetical protein AAFO99_00645 [Bacteroidota bacterium]